MVAIFAARKVPPRSRTTTQDAPGSIHQSRSVSHLCDLSKVHTIVTDSDAPAELVSQLRVKGIEVILAPASN